MISDILKKIRKQHHLTQQDLADQLFVSPKTVSSWENNRTIPDIYILEKISKIYQIQMNDLMDGNISKYSIIKYKVKQCFKQIFKLMTNNVYYSVLIVLNVMSIILLAFLPVLPLWTYIQLIIFSTIIFLSLKFSKWYFLLSVLPIFELFRNLWLFIDTSSYMIKREMGDLEFLDSLSNYTALAGLGILIIYGIYLFIRKHKKRFSHLLVIFINFIWLFVYYLYNMSYIIHQWYSGFTQERWYVIERNSNFWLYTLGYIGLINLILIVHKITKNKQYV